MAVVHYSKLAEADLDLIAAYTVKRWGRLQAATYLEELESACQRLAANPKLGRLHKGKRSETRRMEQGNHVIFYERFASGILVGRILHQSMLPEKHNL